MKLITKLLNIKDITNQTKVNLILKEYPFPKYDIKFPLIYSNNKFIYLNLQQKLKSIFFSNKFDWMQKINLKHKIIELSYFKII